MIVPQLDGSSGSRGPSSSAIWDGFIKRRASHHSFDPISYDLILRVLGSRVEHPHKAEVLILFPQAAWLLCVGRCVLYFWL